MDSKTFMIGVLSTTATILFATLVIIGTRPSGAQASGMTASGGEYVLTVGLDASADEELVYIIDSVARRLIVYRFDSARQEIQIAQGIELKDLDRDENQRGQPPRRGGRNRP